MNVSLTPELEQLVSDKVKTGLYQTASEEDEAAERAVGSGNLARARFPRGGGKGGKAAFACTLVIALMLR